MHATQRMTKVVLGEVVPGGPAPQPKHLTLQGQYVTLVPFSRVHFPQLFDEVGGRQNAHLWDYMLNGPFESYSDFYEAMLPRETSLDPLVFTICYRQSSDQVKPCGICALLHVDCENRSVELGHLMYSPTSLSRHPGATEATYLLARHSIEVWGFRRFEWKCNNNNQPSRNAAARLGFRFEGVFRKHMVVKGRSRDSAWYACCDDDWYGGVKAALEHWLMPRNFDADGKQREKLETIRARLVKEGHLVRCRASHE